MTQRYDTTRAVPRLSSRPRPDERPYLIGISDISADEAGNFQLSIDCIFGDCPSVPPLVPDVSGRILAGGEPLAAASVFLRGRGAARQRTRTDGMGVFEFEEVPSGPFYMCVRGRRP